jgi:hypothetical protein
MESWAAERVKLVSTVFAAEGLDGQIDAMSRYLISHVLTGAAGRGPRNRGGTGDDD